MQCFPRYAPSAPQRSRFPVYASLTARYSLVNPVRLVQALGRSASALWVSRGPICIQAHARVPVLPAICFSYIPALRGMIEVMNGLHTNFSLRDDCGFFPHDKAAQ